MTSLHDKVEPRGMPTNGKGEFIDWLNHTRSLADHPDTERARLIAATERRRRQRDADAAVKREAARQRFAGDDRSAR